MLMRTVEMPRWVHKKDPLCLTPDSVLVYEKENPKKFCWLWLRYSSYSSV